MLDTFENQETDAFLESAGPPRGISEAALSGSTSVIDTIKPYTEPANHHKKSEDSHDRGKERFVQVKAELKTEEVSAQQERTQGLTTREDVVPGDPEAIHTQTEANADEEIKTKEAKSRLSQAATKLKKGINNLLLIPDLERLTDRAYTQEELFQLVKDAEAEMLQEKIEEQKKKGLGAPAVTKEAGAVDMAALAAAATKITEDIEANELSFSEIFEKEKSGEKINNAEFLLLWENRQMLMDSLSENQGKQYAYFRQLSDQATAALVYKLFTPARTLIWKMWDSLNKQNPTHVALPKLRSAVYAKTRKEHGDGWGLKNELQYKQWQKHASPTELAREITIKQMAKTDFVLTA